MSSDVEWKLNENGDWTLEFEDVEVEFLIKTQKEKLKPVVERLKHKN